MRKNMCRRIIRDGFGYWAVGADSPDEMAKIYNEYLGEYMIDSIKSSLKFMVETEQEHISYSSYYEKYGDTVLPSNSCAFEVCYLTNEIMILASQFDGETSGCPIDNCPRLSDCRGCILVSSFAKSNDIKKFDNTASIIISKDPAAPGKVYIIGSPVFKQTEEATERARVVIAALFTFLNAVYSCRGQMRESRPNKDEVALTRKNKSAIPYDTYKTISISSGAERPEQCREGELDPLGSCRSLPRAHVRRGHYRRTARGTVFVRDTVVAAWRDNRVVKDYAVVGHGRL